MLINLSDNVIAQQVFVDDCLGFQKEVQNVDYYTKRNVYYMRVQSPGKHKN